MIDALAQAALLVVHVLGGGVWVGAMVFSIFVLHPRAEGFFERDADFEGFIFHVVHGARWKVFSGVMAILLSGIALCFWPGHAARGSRSAGAACRSSGIPSREVARAAALPSPGRARPA